MKKIKNIVELAAVMEMTKSTIKNNKNENISIFCGIDGLKKQLEKSSQKFPGKKQVCIFYLVLVGSGDNLGMEIKNIWINRDSGKVINEPRWFKKMKTSTQTIDPTQTLG